MSPIWQPVAALVRAGSQLMRDPIRPYLMRPTKRHCTRHFWCALLLVKKHPDLCTCLLRRTPCQNFSFSKHFTVQSWKMCPPVDDFRNYTISVWWYWYIYIYLFCFRVVGWLLTLCAMHSYRYEVSFSPGHSTEKNGTRPPGGAQNWSFSINI